MNIGPSLNPSNVTDPIITATNATMPGSGSSRVSRDSGRRMPSTPSRRSNGEIRENRLK